MTSSLRTEERVSAIAEQYGFADRLSVEKFIMDFEMHSHITGQVECITRGGIRSEDTIRWLGNLFTCITTWHQQEMDAMANVARYV